MRAAVPMADRVYSLQNVLQGRTQGRQIAQKRHCSKATIVSPLTLLRLRLDCHPSRLRKYSAHFDGIENSMSDSRARRIHRKSTIADEGEPEDHY